MAAADTLSPLLNLLLMGDGLHFNAWGPLLNADLTTLENTVAGNAIIPVTAPAMTLTIPQINAAIMTFTGTLTANTLITLPSVSRKFVVSNQTTGSFSLSLQAGAGVPLLIPQGISQTHICYSDGQNVFDASQAAATITALITAANASYLPPGAIQEFAMNAAPGGWSECDGGILSRTVDAPLFAAIGVTWGAGDGLTTFNKPDFRGTFRRAWDHGKGIDTGRAFASFQADAFASHTHVQNPHNHTYADPGHNHSVNVPNGAVGASGGAVNAGTTPSVTGAAVIGITINNATATNQATGGAETIVKNYATLVCIRR